MVAAELTLESIRRASQFDRHWHSCIVDEDLRPIVKITQYPELNTYVNGFVDLLRCQLDGRNRCEIENNHFNVG